MKKDLGYVKGPKGDTGPQGAVGPQGAKGEKGDPARVCGKLAGADGNIQLVAADVGGLSAEQINALLLNKAFLKQPANSINYDNEYNFNGITPYSDKRMGTSPPGSPEWMNVVTLNPGSFFASQLCFGLNSIGTAQGLYFRSRWSDNLDGTWFPWMPLATAAPPQEHDLPLAEGWTAGRKTKFSVSQESLVLVTFGVWGPANTSDRAVIAQLPPGFRPGELISTECMVTDESTYTRYSAGLDVNRAGEVIVFSKQPGWTIAVGQVAFYVSD